MDNNMNYQDFIDKLGHSYMAHDMWEYYYILTNESLTSAEVLDEVVKECPGMSGVLINGKDKDWYVAIPKPNELTEGFPGQLTNIKEEVV